MTYEKLVDKVKKAYAKADASMVNEHIAVQVDVTGEAHGAFYIEIADKKMNVQPYDYHDKDMLINTDEKAIVDIASGKLKVSDAVNSNKISVSGPNYSNAIAALDSVVFEKTAAAKKTTSKTTTKKTASKTTAKKTETKKAETKKTEAKAPAKTAVKSAEAPKASVKKTEDAKVTAKKADVKPVAVEVKSASKTEVKPAAKAPAKKSAAKKTK